MMSARISVFDNGAPAYRASVNVDRTLVEDYAPYGTGTPEPHFIGYGQTPEEAVRAAFEEIGRKVVKMAGDP
jgi:hypothetical protein